MDEEWIDAYEAEFVIFLRLQVEKRFYIFCADESEIFGIFKSRYAIGKANGGLLLQ